MLKKKCLKTNLNESHYRSELSNTENSSTNLKNYGQHICEQRSLKIVVVICSKTSNGYYEARNTREK